MDTDSGPNAGTGQDPDGDTGDQQTTTTTNDPHVATLNAENRKWRKLAQTKEQELEALRAKHSTEAEQAIAKARTEGETAFKARWQTAQRENLAITRLAKKGVTETELAIRALDLSHVDVDDEGRVDSAALDAAIEELLKRHPVLAPPRSDGDSTPDLKGLDSQQRRVTREDLLKADADKRNELLRYALGR